MVTRNKILGKAVDECIKELYSLVQPSVTWEDFLEENKAYKECQENLKSKIPAPYEFYYLPKEILNDVIDSYRNAYKINGNEELLNTIDILKDYCKKPIVDKYIEEKIDEDGFRHPGYRGYEHPDNLEKEINTYLDLKFPLMNPERAKDAEDFENKLNTAAKELQDKFFEFLDMAGNFYNWSGELNSFNMSVYLGPSPNSCKEKVIENWKLYRNKDIKIDEEQMKKEYYGEEELD